MRILQCLAVISASVSLAACATSSVARVGTDSYPPLPPSAEVAVFTADSQVGRPFEVLANIAYTDPGKFQIMSVSDTYPALKEKAREVGANGIIIDNSSEVISGLISRGISVGARAIYIAGFSPDKASTPPGPQASPAPQAQRTDAPQAQTKDPAQVLRELRKLHDDGVIDDREYEAKKAEVLRRM